MDISVGSVTNIRYVHPRTELGQFGIISFISLPQVAKRERCDPKVGEESNERGNISNNLGVHNYLHIYI